MSVDSVNTNNTATQTTISSYEQQIEHAQTQAETMLAEIASGTSASELSYGSFGAILNQLQDMQYAGLSNLEGDPLTQFNALVSAISTLFDDHSTMDDSALESALLDVQSAAIGALGTTTDLKVRLPVQDMVFYNYSRAGEADLNNQLGQLGDAMDSLNTVLRFVNNIDLVLSINPKNSSGDSYINEEGELGENFFESPDLLNVAGSGKDARIYVRDAFENLLALQQGFDPESSVYQSVQDVVDIMSSSVDVANWNESTSWEGATADSFQALWQDNTLRRKINDLLTSLSSQNDVEKQNLRKAMFLYQEFVKSSGSVLDRIFEAVRSIASRIAR